MYKIEHKLERRMKAHGISETMFTAPRVAVPFMTHSGPKNLPCAHTHLFHLYESSARRRRCFEISPRKYTQLPNKHGTGKVYHCEWFITLNRQPIYSDLK